MTAPLDRLLDLLPPRIREIVDRETPIPTIAARAGELMAADPGLVRADIGQISGFRDDLEVLYGPPSGLNELRATIAEGWNLSHGLTPQTGGLRRENVGITTGAAEGIAALFKCLAQGKKVGIPRGFWENYLNGVALAGGDCVVLDYFDAAGRLDIEGLRRSIRDENIELLVANFPCNPTGAVLVEEEARALGALIEELNIPCIADEVYDRLRYDGVKALSLLPFAPGHVIAVSSASKEYLLPGARVGYVLSARSQVTDLVLRKLIRASSGGPNVLGQRQMLSRLSADLEDLRAGREPGLLSSVRDEMARRRDGLLEVLESFGFGSVGRPGHRPEGTIFLMASLPDWWRDDEEAFARAALEARCVSTVPGTAFGLPGSVRFSYGGMTVERIAKLADNLDRFRAQTIL